MRGWVLLILLLCLGCCEYAPAQDYVEVSPSDRFEELLDDATKKTDKELFGGEFPEFWDEPETSLEEAITSVMLNHWDAYKTECLIDTVIVRVYWTGWELKYRIDYIDSEKETSFRQLEDMGYRFRYNISEPDSLGVLYRDVFGREPTLSGFMEYLRGVK